MKEMPWKRSGLALLAVALAAMLVAGLSACGARSSGGMGGKDASDNPASADEKTFVYGTTGYGVQMDDAGLNPHSAYSGWSAVRYGVGETLFKFNDAMEAEPWLATSYEFVGDTHVRITLRDDVTFSSGRAMDGAAVKECLDDLVATHVRAPSDMKIVGIEAEGHTVTIQTSEPCPALINYLCDPYGAIIDMQAGVTSDDNVSGTGPYVAQTVTDSQIVLHKNESYWGGTPKVDTVIVREFSDTDALQSALQSGQIDACYGLAYASYALFQNDGYRIADCFTSRWLTYPGRLELPLLAESAQATLKDIGFDVQIDCTANHTQVRSDADAWDVYVSALTTAPTGDPEYFFGATCLGDSSKNFGAYHSPTLDELYQRLHVAFGADERARLATQMSQTILDDHGYFFASFLQMGIVSKANVRGLSAHPSDYHVITVDLDV